jgi:hypothetical protein
MTWYKRTVAKEHALLEFAICNELLEIGISIAEPPPFNIYMTKPGIVPPLDSVTIYFPPEAASYCPAILTKYEFAVCDKPDLGMLDIFCTPG